MKKRMLALIMAVGMMLTALAGCGNSNAASSSSAEASSSKKSQTDDAVTTAAEQLLGHSDSNGKEETVYVIAKPNGTPEQVIVSEWLKNKDGASTIQDASSLSDIKNVKGNEDYTQGSGNKLTWNANGNDIYYQGTSTAQLPVDVRLSYKLDGKSVSAEQLDGATGKLTISFTYQNNAKKTQKINGKNVTIYQPFLMVSGLLLDNEKASDVKVTNGKVINSGDKTVVVGLAMPGLSESLGVKNLTDKDGKSIDLDIPEKVTITANVTNFSLLTTVTVAENSALEELNLDDVSNVDDLKDSLKKLGDSSTKLVDGSKTLFKGIGELDDKSGDLADGVSKIDQSTKQIASGSNTLSNGAITANSGANKVADAAGQVSQGSSTVAAGMNKLANSVADLPEASAQLLTGAKSVKTALGNKKSTGTTIYTGAQSIVEGANQISASLKNSNNTSIYEAATGIKAGADTITKGTDDLSSGMNEAIAALKTSEGYVNDAIKQLTALSKADGVSEELKTSYAGIIKELGASVQYQEGVSGKLSKVDVSELKNGAEQISAYAEKIANGSVSLAAGTDKIAAGAKSIQNGIDTMVSGNNGSNLNALIDGLNQLNDQSGELVSGTKQLADGTNDLADGSKKLENGTNDLADGTADLANGAEEMSGYLGQLSDGTGALSQGTGTLIDGIGQLLDGADDLATGMAKFDKEGIQKLTNLMDSDLTGIVDRVKALQDYAKEYSSYGGNVEDMDCSTKFIYKTDSIGE